MPELTIQPPDPAAPVDPAECRRWASALLHEHDEAAGPAATAWLLLALSADLSAIRRQLGKAR